MLTNKLDLKEMSSPFRKSVSDLTPDDFKTSPCWEHTTEDTLFARGSPTMVRPIPVTSLPEATRQVIAGASFHFPSGRVRSGMVTVNRGHDVSAHSPIVFVSRELVNFYFGATQPTATDVRRFTNLLQRLSTEPLPVRYVSTLCTKDGVPLAEGVLEGLYWWHNFPHGELRVEV
jgi:hypothetical protein